MESHVSNHLIKERFEDTLQGTINSIREQGDFDVIDVLSTFLDHAESNGLRLWAVESGVEGIQVSTGSVH